MVGAQTLKLTGRTLAASWSRVTASAAATSSASFCFPASCPAAAAAAAAAACRRLSACWRLSASAASNATVCSVLALPLDASSACGMDKKELLDSGAPSYSH